jgi:hypothetical protein
MSIEVTLDNPGSAEGIVAVLSSNVLSFKARSDGSAIALAGDITGDVVGDVTGDVAGDLTGDVTGDVTGNIAGEVTASKLVLPEGSPANAVAAQGTITMSGIAVADETFVVDDQTFTWKAARGGTGEVTIGANAPAAVTNIVTAITADLTTVTAADGDGDTVVLTAATKGAAGDAIVLTEDSTNMAVDGSGTLGATTGGIDGTVGDKGDACFDGEYLYLAIDDNTIADDNWRRISLGSVYYGS